jgi:hypothetical protein
MGALIVDRHLQLRDDRAVSRDVRSYSAATTSMSTSMESHQNTTTEKVDHMANPASGSPVRARKSERTEESSVRGAQPAAPGQSADTSSALKSASAIPSSTPAEARDWSASAERHSQTTSGGNGIADKLREQAKSRLSSQKDRALDGVGGVTKAIRETTQSLRDRQHDTVARYVEQATEQVDRITQRLKEKDVVELLEDAQQLARRQPALFVGAAFALGLLGARFLKSSPPDRRRDFESARSPQETGIWRASTPATGYASSTSTRR